MMLTNEICNLKSFLLLGIFALASNLVVFAEVGRNDREALVALYNTTNGDEWTKTGDLNEPVSNWYGVKVVNDRVVEINLFRNNLQGVLPESIGRLSHLVQLNLAFNAISGEIPTSLVQLTELKVLRLEMNRIKGELPLDIGKIGPF